MIVNIITLFPEAFASFLEFGLVKKALKLKALKVNIVNLRDFGLGAYKQVDDYPYGGGAGMVLKPEPIFAALQSLKFQTKNLPVIFFTPQAPLLKQMHINRISQSSEIILLCGHYKGIDQRIRDAFVSEEYSIGDYVLSGGELPAMIFTDAIARLQDSVLNDIESALTDSHQDGILGCPQYTRPPVFQELKVPQVLLNGNHKKISQWRMKKSEELTKTVRPDLLEDE